MRALALNTMNRTRAIIFLLFATLCWGGLTVNFVMQGNGWAATFASLPFIAFALFLVSPFKGPGSFAFIQELGPVQEGDETYRQYHFRMAKYWFSASLLFPVSLVAAYLFEKYQTFVIACMFAGFLFGVPCFLKGLGSLYNGIRAKS